MSKLLGFGTNGVRVLGAFSALFVLAAAANCGSSSSDPGTVADTGVGVDTNVPPGEGGTDTNKPTEGGTDVKPSEVGTPDIKSTLLADGTFQPLSSNGMTSDDFFICFDDAGQAVAINTAGTAPVTPDVIDKTGASILVSGKAVFSWHAVDSKTSIGTLVVWTKASGAHELTKTAVLGEAAASADGTTIIFADNAHGGGKTVDLTVAKADGTIIAKSVIKDVLEDSTSTTAPCTPTFAWSGNKPLVNWCAIPVVGETGADVGVDADVAVDVGADTADAAAPAGAIASLSLIDGTTVTSLRSNLQNRLSVDKAGAKAFVIDFNGDIQVLPIPTGAALPIDTKGSFGDLLAAGDKAIYVTTTGDFKIATVGATPAPVTLGTKVQVFFNIPDAAKYVYYGTNYNSKTGVSDLFLVPLAGGTALNLDAKPDGAIFGDQFTADGTLALYYVAVSAGTGDMMVVDPTKAVTTAEKLAPGVWVSYSPKGSVVVYNDGYIAGSGDGQANLRIIDAKSKAKNLVAVQAEADFYMNHAKTKIIYSSQDVSVKPGLYVADVP